MVETLSSAWVRALTEPLPAERTSDTIWTAGGAAAPTAYIVQALRARVSHGRRRTLDHARALPGAVALQLPAPASADQLERVVRSFNERGSSHPLAGRMVHSRLGGPTRSARGFVQDALRVKLACGTGSRLEEGDLLSTLLHAARVVRICLWIVAHAERAQPDLLHLFDAWLALPGAPPHLLLELCQGRRYWIVTNLPAPLG